MPAAPQAPDIKARPFLDAVPGEGWQQSLQKLMMGTGLIAQMAIGIKGGFPEGALAAYTGALQGWQAGDAIRAGNEWKTYVGQLQQYDRDVGATQQKFENAMKTYGHNQDRLKTEFGILAAEHGLSREGIEMGFREPDRLLSQLNSGVKVMEQMLKDADNVTFRNMMGLHKLEQDQQMNEFRREQLDLRKRELEKKGSEKPLGEHAAKWENPEGQRPDPRMSIAEAAALGFRPMGKISTGDAHRTAATLMDQLDGLIPKLEAKGFLASGDGRIPIERARLARFWKPGDEDYGAWKAHAGTMVAIQRQLGDIGPRAMAAFQSAVDIVEHPTTAAAARKAIGQLREALREGQPRVFGGPTGPHSTADDPLGILR